MNFRSTSPADPAARPSRPNLSAAHRHLVSLSFVTALAASSSLGCSSSDTPDALESSTTALASTLACDVVIAGGTTAALAAALTSAREGVQTCLLEPTDWPGGQLTAEGVPAIDFAWENVSGYAMATIAKQPANQPRELLAWLAKVGDPGHCSVSENCFQPKDLLTSAINPAISSVGSKLTVLKNTVVKSVVTATAGGRTRIAQLRAIRRTPTAAAAWGGYDVNLSKDMPDWYSPKDSARYKKESITISPRGASMVVVDATDLGDVLAVSGAPYLQGAEATEGGLDAFDDRCGQTITFPFYMRYEAAAVADDLPATKPDHPEQYGYENGYDFAAVWRYRRVRGSTAQPAVADISNQNWRLGNDYAHGSILRSKRDAAAERADWKGGVDYAQLYAAEREAYGWFRWFRGSMPGGKGNHLSLARDVSGTGHGLAKFPYLRDTRRSVGWNGFILKQSDLEDDGSGLTGKRFIDRIAIGLYSADLHPMKTCRYPDFVFGRWTPYPYYIPLRALTNRDVANLLVAGKTMAQSFQVNAATRLHPIEMSSGIGAGAAAATMIGKGIDDSAQLVLKYADVQAVARKSTPIDWTINAVTYPRPGEALEAIVAPHR